uniref:Tumor necrosis factor ligand superfamily member 15 n=1 Tax=Geotrypetes seraphini TaxID=260995 RepID=A0A6P8SG75_GEOSA|nr:tumor necrosis factor ligand superfamily member 15 [Geotrypetes seraphini]
MEPATEMLQVDHEQGSTAKQRKPSKDLNLRKTQLALACCLICVCVQGISMVYLFSGQHRAAKEADSAVQVQNWSLSESISSQDAGSAKGNEEKPRAHLTGTIKQDHLDAIGDSQALPWEHHYGLAFLKKGMKYMNRSLEIPQSGDYFVYAQVTFRYYGLDCTNSKKKLNTNDHIIQVISKVTASYPVPATLLSGSKYLCEMTSKWHAPIYMGAVFYLKEGDRLMVNVSNITLVDATSEHRTFFGAFLL